MTTSQTISESKAVELSAESLRAFCQEIERKFGTHVNWQQKDVVSGRIESFENHFKNLVAVSNIESHGVLEAGFGVLFDQRGLFIVGGVMLTVGQEKIAEDAQKCSAEAAEATSEGLKIVGDILADCWQKVLQKSLGQSNEVLHTKTFISKGLKSATEQIGSGGNKEVLLVEYEMAIEPYPPFKCGVIFGKDIFGVSSKDDAVEASGEQQEDDSQAAQVAESVEDAAGNEEPAGEKEKTAETKDEANNLEAEAVKEQQACEQATQAEEGGEQIQGAPQAQQAAEVEKGQAAQQEGQGRVQETGRGGEAETVEAQEESEQRQEVPEDGQEPQHQAQTPETSDAAESETVNEAQVPEKKGEIEETAEEPSEQAQDESQQAGNTDSGDTADKEDDGTGTEEKQASDQETAESKASAMGPISETIQKIAGSPAELPGQNEGRQVDSGSQFNALAGICARDIMQKEIVWISGDVSVQEAISMLQQSDCKYLFIGANKMADGIVSKSDLDAAVSPYLRPVFSKWRQSLDDATLKLKVKWIMSRVVPTIKTDASFDAVIEQLSASDAAALAVIDETGKVEGVVTVNDIFKAVVDGLGNTAAEQPVQMPASAPDAG